MVFMKCNLCSRNCLVDRRYSIGYCQAPYEMVVAKAYLHKWEEPCLVGKLGSGTIFFTYCNLRCLFCQNYEISTMNYGKEISVKRFSDICLDLQKKGASNINLVTPTHFVNRIIEGIDIAKSNGLNIPIVYNTNSYDSISTIDMLDGYIDVYLPDLKYYDDEIAIRYSKAYNYFEIASMAIDRMYKQVGKCKFKDGNIIRGVIVRHLMLPGHLDDSKKIIKYLYDKYKNNIYISIMRQYTPIKKLEYDNLNRTITDSEYDELIDYAYDIGIRNAYVQEDGSIGESFIPNFRDNDI